MASSVDDDVMQIDTTPSSSVSSSSSSITMQSSLKKVFLSPEAYHFCLTQCLSTEVEEVMGLLIGEVDQQNGYCHVTHSLPLKRLDKRKDRVEIGTEQLASSFSIVEQLSGARSKQQQIIGDTSKKAQLQVVGWYHSHPHITVFPSDVDISTHHQYQSTMSPFWLGLIFGVFNYEEAKATNRFQLIGFQSVEAFGGVTNGIKNGVGGRGSLKHVFVPIVIESRVAPIFDEWALKKAAMLIDLLLEEEKEAYCISQGKRAVKGEEIGRHYNSCVYSKAVAKIITLLGASMVDMLNARKENAIELIKG